MREGAQAGAARPRQGWAIVQGHLQGRRSGRRNFHPGHQGQVRHGHHGLARPWPVRQPGARFGGHQGAGRLQGAGFGDPLAGACRTRRRKRNFHTPRSGRC